MKVRSPSWDDSPAVWAAFQETCSRHLEAMRGILPAHVLELAELEGVEDGLIAAVHEDRGARNLRLTLRCGYIQIGYYDLILTYEDAEITAEDRWLLARLAPSTIDCGDHDADLHRQELDVTPVGRIEHRLEFRVFGQCNAWLAIRCRALRWDTVSRPGRDLPVLPDRFPGGPVTETGRITGMLTPGSDAG